MLWARTQSALSSGSPPATPCCQSNPAAKDAAKAYLYRGAGYLVSGDNDHAIADLSEAIKLDPTDDVALTNRGHAYRRNGEPQLAIADLTRAIELNPKEPANWFYRAVAYGDINDHDHAIADASRAIEIKPDDTYLHDTRGRSYAAKADYERALADYDLRDQAQPRIRRCLFQPRPRSISTSAIMREHWKTTIARSTSIQPFPT